MDDAKHASSRDPSTQPCRSPRPPGCSACTRTRSGPGATPGGCATSGSTPEGDRRYRLGDLQRFLAAAEPHPTDGGPAPRARVATGRHSATGWPPRSPTPDRARATSRSGGSTRCRAPPRRPGRGVHDRAPRQRRPAVAGAPARPRPRRSATPTGITLSPSGSSRRTASSRAPSPSASPAEAARLTDLPRRFGILGAALDAEPHVTDRGGQAMAARGALLTDTLHRGARCPSCPMVAPSSPSRSRARRSRGACSSSSARARTRLARRDLDVVRAVADGIATLVAAHGRAEEIAHLRHRAEALRRVASDIGSRLDLDRILSGLVDHAMVLFEGDGAAVFLHGPDGQPHRRGQPRPVDRVPEQHPRPSGPRSLPAAAVEARPTAVLGRLPGRPARRRTSAPPSSRKASTRCARRPLIEADNVVGLLNIYHDQPHAWTDAELETVEALATQASVAIRAAQDYERMANWAAQLQSIQQLGARLNRLSSVTEIGQAIATELRQLIDYHNARVYRLVGQELIPVAMQGQVGEYVDETPDQLRLTIGEGITGWVAANRIAQNLGNAAADPRASTIPGTEDDLDESMLLAPMLFDDQVLGRPRALQARAQPLQRRRPAAARDLRELRRPGHGQRRHDRAAPPPEPCPGAPAAQPARAPPDHRIAPDHARRPRRPRQHHRAARPADRLRQHRDRGGRSGHGPADAADGPRRPRGVLPGAVGARRDGRRHLGRGARRAGLHPRRTGRSAGQPSRRRTGRGQPDRRPAAQPRRRDRRADDRTARRRATRSRSTSSSSSSSSPRRSPSRSRTPRSSRRSRSARGRTA